MTGNNNINQYVDKKPVELVQEINNETPSFEEFMKTYEKSGVNYDDLEGGGISEVKGYGPCSGHANSCGNFSLRIECHNWNGIGGIRKANSTSEALLYAYELEHNSWQNSSTVSNEVMQQCAFLVSEAVKKHNLGKRINGYVKVQGNFLGSPSWSYSY